ncbi:PLP-dependent transferase [Parashewanella curva]|uniref:PLP-dependent transferase n=1 Tax=Parashewanella curva TaxID=2338552 RepID=A0A3L8PZ85_9GAMM|nr:PLP-dependent aspartate aminotransferase family protein [Parashewanella curva]RLV59838.1 PLP-dependent transferase [Parashewanella curva]
MKFKTKVLHSYKVEDQHGALNIPIYQSSTYQYPNFESGKARFSGDEQGFIYSRMANPTVSALEQTLAQIEGAEQALVVSSGMAALSSIFIALCHQDDHIAVVEPVYGGSSAMLSQTLTRFGVNVHRYFSDDDLLERIHSQTKIILFEPISNPTLAINDFRKVKKAAEKVGAITVCDNTLYSPYFFRPLEHGMDLVMHSATKYLSGHGDIIAGVVAGANALMDQVRTIGLKHLGASISPQDAYLLSRGLRTLPLRMEAHQQGAMKVAEFLESHPKVEKVHYSGLKSSPYHQIASQSVGHFGGLVSFELVGGESACQKTLDNLQLFTQAVSLGDLESLACHPATTTHAAVSPELRQEAGISDSLIRLSIGVEAPEDLIADLSQALG